MRRNPKLAHEVRDLPEVVEARHLAIDKVTAAHLAVELLGRKQERNISAVEEIEMEERASELMNDAVYFFNKYMMIKKRIYEMRLHETFEKGNEEILYHSKVLDELKQERGLS